MGIFNRHRHLRPEILSEYLDGRLDQRHQELVARQMADCPACREELNTLQTTVSALRSLPDLPLPRSFTLPTAPSPDYPDKLIRKPAPLVMKMPAWAYGSAASLAGLALALMLSAEAAGLASPAAFQTTGQTTGQATAAPEAAAVAKEAQVEAQVAAPEMTDQAEAPADSMAAPVPQAALRAESAPAPAAATETGDSALAAKGLAEPVAAAPEAAMAESQDAVERGSAPAGEETAAFSETQSDDGASVPVGEEAATPSGTPSADVAPVPEESPPSLPAEEIPAGPADTIQNLAMEAETPEENLSFAAEEYSTPSSSTWWKALETTLAALTLAFLGGLFFRWRRNRSDFDA